MKTKNHPNTMKHKLLSALCIMALAAFAVTPLHANDPTPAPIPTGQHFDAPAPTVILNPTTLTFAPVKTATPLVVHAYRVPMLCASSDFRPALRTPFDVLESAAEPLALYQNKIEYDSPILAKLTPLTLRTDYPVQPQFGGGGDTSLRLGQPFQVPPAFQNQRLRLL